MKVRDAIKKTIASNIKRARIASNMTQAEAAEKLGITILNEDEFFIMVNQH